MSRQQERHRWYGMLYRCENPRSSAYPRYGDRGIKVCERWHDFEAYYTDIMEALGPCPAGMTLDRIDNDGNYEPGNVRWASCWQQVLNSQVCGPRRQPQELQPVIDGTSPAHDYVQLADHLRAGIRSGGIVDMLPTLADLCEQTGLAYNTARRAVKLLKDEGLVSTAPGRGTFVSKR